jgi:hypothetical protein
MMSSAIAILGGRCNDYGWPGFRLYLIQIKYFGYPAHYTASQAFRSGSAPLRASHE